MCFAHSALSNDVKYNGYNRRNMHVFLASENGHTGILQLLFDNVSGYVMDDVMDEEDVWGRTPLHYAAYHGHVEVVKILIQRGAKMAVKDASSRTPLDLARLAQAFFQKLDPNYSEFPIKHYNYHCVCLLLEASIPSTSKPKEQLHEHESLESLLMPSEDEEDVEDNSKTDIDDMTEEEQTALAIKQSMQQK